MLRASHKLRLAYLEPLLKNQFLRFSLVGGVGFVVDVIVLYGFVYILGLGLLSSRVFSYLSAATTTWYLNKIFTFRSGVNHNPVLQWLRFLVVNGIGGIANYFVYFIVIKYYGVHLVAPLLGVVLGTLTGLAFNYTLSKRLVFR